MSGSLVVVLGRREWRFPRTATVLVGRDAQCDIHVDDPRVSRQHLRIEYQDGWVVHDLDSTHGSWLDGERIVRQPLVSQLTIRLAGAVPIELDAGGSVQSGQSVTVGRARDNDIVLADVRVSRYHARLDQVAGGWQVTDLSSRNGIIVNATPVTGPVMVSDGDRLTFGGTDLTVLGEDFVPAGTARASLVAQDVSYSLPDGRSLLSNVDLEVQPGELLAIVGPSGAGKSTLLKVLTGQLRPTGGSVRYDDYDLHDGLAAVRGRIGVVPQDDVVHRLLTARQALSYSAMLRLPADTTRRERRAIVDATLAELSLTEHADTRIGRLSGGQRKRVSVALELLTSPSLLLLDEPTSGLDPALDRQLMGSLRQLADAGRTVVVVTHNVHNLSQCDTVVVLAPGGIPVYTGPPGRLHGTFGTDDWADVITMVAAAEPPAARDPTPRPPSRRAATPPVSRATVTRQLGVLIRRHLRLILADRGYAAFLAGLPIALGILALAVPGHAGLRNVDALESVEAGQILVLVLVGAAFMGGAAGAREVIGERDIVARERAAGVLPIAYVTGKATVFGAVCAVQSALLVAVLMAVKPPPAKGILLAAPTLELGIAVWATAAVSCLVGLLGSALVRSAEQAMPVLVVTVMAQLVLCGGMVPVTGRPVLSELSWLAPTRWGYAAGASTVNLPGTDALWAHTPRAWLLDLAALAIGAALFTALFLLRMRGLRRRVS